MEVHFDLNGLPFVWNEDKAKRNAAKHGIEFTAAAEVFFDPFFSLVDASRNDEARDALIGRDARGRVLFVVHVEIEDEYIRIISARRATREELKRHDS